MDLVEGSLLLHCQIQHGMGRGDQGSSPPPQGGPDLLGLFPNDDFKNPFPSGGMSMGGDKLDQPLGSI